MKRLFAVLALVACALPVRADDETLFSDKDVWNLYSKLEAKFSKVGEDDGFFGGVQVGGILNDGFSAGIGLYALATEVEPGFNGYENPQTFDIWYGGLVLEYTFFSRKLLHASVSGLVGGGQMRLDRTSDGEDKDIDLFVLEPTLNLMVNITQRTEFGLGIGYRHADAYGTKLEGVSDGDLSGAVGNIFLRFTEF